MRPAVQDLRLYPWQPYGSGTLVHKAWTQTPPNACAVGAPRVGPGGWEPQNLRLKPGPAAEAPWFVVVRWKPVSFRVGHRPCGHSGM